jgi:hypothetical protein
MRGDKSKAMGDDKCVYGKWAICVTSPLIASEIEGIRTPNRGLIIPFFVVIFLIKGKREYAQL